MSAPTPDQTGDRHRFTNRLAAEKSPYLLQHAHNPVNWYAWGEEAFTAARDGDKPIFLSIGYSACHWCHVMERESFENEKIAAVLNNRFISIKVDREERPDVDEVYMTAVQMTTGSGGWPMSVFMMPDGRPFYGGTYFPPEGRQGRIGFGSLITQLADAYYDRRSEVESVATSIVDELQKLARQRPVASAAPVVAEDLLRLAIDDMSERFDAANGGFGGAPKFPPHNELRLLTVAARRGDTEAKRMLRTTLYKMASGGIYDQFGGGFHRYSTDAVWLVPHFEKMLYDNALLARVYAETSAFTGSSDYERIAREVCDWVIRDMTDDVGGFHAALDADSEGEEGRYYVWTQDEVRLLLGDSVMTTDLCRLYHILPGGNYRDEATGQPTGANIPYLSIRADDQVTLAPISAATIPTSKSLLLALRDHRIPPSKDDKVITAWNGLMIGALAVCGLTLDEPQYVASARTAAEFCLSTLRSSDGGLLRRYAKGEAGLPAFLDDYAFLADGLLDLHSATQEPRYLDEARSLADVILDRFWDPEDSGFFYAADGHEALIAKTKDLFDGALPSANGVAVRLLVRLGQYPDGQRYQDHAAKTLTAYAGVLTRAPQGTPTLIEATLIAASGLRSPDAIAPVTGRPVTITATEPAVVAAPGQSLTLTFDLRIAAGYHINASEPTNAALIPTTATLSSNVPAAAGPVNYPEPVMWSSAGETLPTYQGDAQFAVPIVLAKTARPGNYRVAVTIRCQVCNETACLAPEELSATTEVVVRW